MRGLLIFLFIIFSYAGFAQDLSHAGKDSLVTGIKKVLQDNYVIADKAKLIADSLRSDKYYEIESIDSLIRTLNKDLFYYSNDKHLALQYQPKIASKLANKQDIHADQNSREKKENYGFAKPEFPEKEIGIMRIRYFADASNAKKAVLSHFRKFKQVRALIIDLRGNAGGNGTMLQLLAGIFLPENETEILRINYRDGNIVKLKSTAIDAAGKYLKEPVYILCDSKTFSAGEAFCLIMKNRGRATLIGETTAGAGNIAGPHAINDAFILNVPVGIIVDPLSNLGWEHTGVVPDIVIKPELALNKALELAKQAR